MTDEVQLPDTDDPYQLLDVKPGYDTNPTAVKAGHVRRDVGRSGPLPAPVEPLRSV